MKPFAKFDTELDSIIKESHKKVLDAGIKAVSEHFKYINTGTRNGRIMTVCNEICYNVLRYNPTRKNPYRVTILANPNKPLDNAKQFKKQIESILKQKEERCYFLHDLDERVKIKIVRLPQKEGTVCDEFYVDYDL